MNIVIQMSVKITGMELEYLTRFFNTLNIFPHNLTTIIIN